jgi:phosphoribosylformylglycinamidine cyclo-ligase
MIRRYADIVDYDRLDPVKRKAMSTFASTLMHPERLRIRVLPSGGTAAVLDFLDYDFMLAFNVEGLGTKNLIADAMYREITAKAELAKKFQSGRLYSQLGQDVVSMAVTDLVAVGADPIAFADIIASGDSSWFKDEERLDSLLEGYKVGAERAECAIPQGETPTLSGIVSPETLDLGGGALGIIRPKSRLVDGHNITPGDTIYGLPSHGICANGVSKARRIAEQLTQGYFTRLPDDRTLGEALLEPTPIWARPIMDMLDAGVDIHYISPITGHGWRKIARAPTPFRYIVEHLPDTPPVFQFLVENGKKLGFDVSNQENYQVWNMGIFIVLIAPKDAGLTIAREANRHGCHVHVLGHVEKGEKEVVIEPKKILYKGGFE